MKFLYGAIFKLHIAAASFFKFYQQITVINRLYGKKMHYIKEPLLIFPLPSVCVLDPFSKQMRRNQLNRWIDRYLNIFERVFLEKCIILKILKYIDFPSDN